MIAGGDGGGQAQCGRHPSPAPNRHQVRPHLGMPLPIKFCARFAEGGVCHGWERRYVMLQFPTKQVCGG